MKRDNELPPVGIVPPEVQKLMYQNNTKFDVGVFDPHLLKQFAEMLIETGMEAVPIVALRHEFVECGSLVAEIDEADPVYYIAIAGRQVVSGGEKK